jgi:hypothetical protein
LCLLSLFLAPATAAQDELLPLDRRVNEAIRTGLEWMLDHQTDQGAWGSHHSPRPIEVFATVPGSHDTFRVGTTALGVMAVSDAARHLNSQDERVREAIDRGIDHLLEHWNVKRVDGLEHYSVWAFGYGLRALAERLIEVPDDSRAERIREVCREIVGKLGKYQDLDGGWGYLSLDGAKTYQPSWTSMSFTTATITIALARARDAGIELPESMVTRCLDSIERCRTPKGFFTYGKLWNRSPGSLINEEPGAACRTPGCQLALLEFGREVPSKDQENGLQNLLVRHVRFQILALRRPIPHESWYAVSGYFYLYGHAYAAWLMEDMPESTRKRFSPALAEAVLRCRQPDGSFWDYPLYSYHKPYGTAYALAALTRLEL